MWNLKKQEKNQKTRNRLLGIENKLIIARWGEVGRLGGKVKELRSTDWQLQNSHGNIKYNIGNMSNNIVITIQVDARLIEGITL